MPHYLLVMWMEKLGLEEKWIAVMCLLTELTVHACNMFNHQKLITIGLTLLK